jgi:HK97 family phage prohead protease
MTMVFKDFISGSQFQTLADKRQVQVICSTGSVDRMGEVVDQNGIDLSAYRSNPVILWNHNPNVPIARAIDIGVVNGKLQATCQFPPSGISQKADEVLGLVQAGVINGVSVGFRPIQTEPMSKAVPRGPQRYIRSSLQEFSIVTVPANAEALVTARSAALATQSTDTAEARARRLRILDVMRLRMAPISESDLRSAAEYEARRERIRRAELLRFPPVV